MAAKITNQIPVQNFELIRDKIAEILALELPIQTAASSIKKVWIERFIPFNLEELPAINVTYDNTPYDRHDPKSRHGENQYYIDITTNAKHTATEKGDVLASKNAQRIAGIVSYILSSGEYRTLDFAPGIIQSRWVSDLRMGRLSEGDSLHTIIARITFKVRSSETVGDLTGIAGEVFTSKIQLDETDKGYFIEINNE